MPPATPMGIPSSLSSLCDALSILPRLLISVTPARVILHIITLSSYSTAFFNVMPAQVPLIITAPATPQFTPIIAHAESAFNALQNWYDASSGLYTTTGWWNSANCLTAIADLALLDPKSKPLALATLSNSFIQAPQNNIYIKKSISPDTYLIQTEQTAYLAPNNPVVTTTSPGFLNDYYDDEGWWALAWIRAYDLTTNTHPEYLTAAITIFADMRLGSMTPCGGIWWDKHNSYVNAIANSLYLSVAAHLARRAPSMSQREEFLQIAEEQWLWFEKSGMINARGTVNDGLRGDCTTNNGTVWSYNQGVVISALAELYQASSSSSSSFREQEQGQEVSLSNTDTDTDTKQQKMKNKKSKTKSKSNYLNTASRIAHAAIDQLSDAKGVLHDVCEPACGADGNQFKGVFMRGLMDLLDVGRADGKIEAFVQVNAESIWAWDRGDGDVLGLVWSGPVGKVDAATQSSALDALVAGVSLVR